MLGVLGGKPAEVDVPLFLPTLELREDGPLRPESSPSVRMDSFSIPSTSSSELVSLPLPLLLPPLPAPEATAFCVRALRKSKRSVGVSQISSSTSPISSVDGIEGTGSQTTPSESPSSNDFDAALHATQRMSVILGATLGSVFGLLFICTIVLLLVLYRRRQKVKKEEG